MNKPRTHPRLIVTRGSLSWLVEHPDNDILNEGLIKAYGEIVPLPLPYTRAASFTEVKAGLSLTFPNHTIIRGDAPYKSVQLLTDKGWQEVLT